MTHSSDARRVTSASPMARALLCMRDAAARVHAGRRGRREQKACHWIEALMDQGLGVAPEKNRIKWSASEHLVCASGTKSGRPRCAGLKGAAGRIGSQAGDGARQAATFHFVASTAAHGCSNDRIGGHPCAPCRSAAPQPPRRAIPRRLHAHLNARRQ
ncbi:Uncharacterised protein [Streptococcus pneumoniae]|nr:Uncharacterised protein [Streptococcus pneumoniae]